MELNQMTDNELMEYYHSENRLSSIKDKRQMALKTALNSFYGALGSPTFRYYELDNAIAITSFGQAAIRFISEKIDVFAKDKLKIPTNSTTWVYGDTDSGYFSFKPLLDKLPQDATYQQKLDLMTKFCDGTVQDHISEQYESFAKWMNCPENKMFMDREAIAVRGGAFIAKKKYFLAVDDLEGKTFPEDKPYWKIMGLEAIKAGSYPAHVRSELKKIIELIALSDETSTQEYIAKLKKDFMNWDVDSISVIKGVTNISKFINPDGLASGTPIHVRAAYNFNRYIENNNIEVEPIKEGDKLKYVFLKSPNPVKDNVVAYIDSRDIETLLPYVDYNLHWVKNVLAPIEIMTKAVGYSSEKVNKLF